MAQNRELRCCRNWKGINT